MKTSTRIKSTVFSIFVLLGSLGLFAQQYHVKTNIQNWKSSPSGYTHEGDYIDGEQGENTGIVITPSYQVRKKSTPNNIDVMGACSEGYIQLKAKNKAATVVFPTYTGVKSFKLNIIAGGANRKITLFNGENSLVTFEGIGKTGASYTYNVSESEQSGSFNFILKDQSDLLYICDIEIEKSGAETKVAVPVFSPSGGEHFEPISVEISSSTAGADIHYTTDETTPTESSPQYNSPITVSATTTLKAKAFKVGLEASEVAEATYTIVTLPEVKTLAEVRALGSNKKLKYTGEAIVSFVSNDKKYLYIQDATGAILIFDKDAKHFSDCEIGYKFKEIEAETFTSNKMLRLRNVEKVEFAGTGELNPKEIELKKLTPEHQAQLVKVKNVKLIKEEGQVFKKGKDVSIEGSEVVVRPQYSGLDYINQPVPDKAQTIVAVVLISNDKIQLVLRSIKEMTPTGLARIPAATKLYSTEGKIHFEAKTGDKVEIYNILGKLLYKTTAQGGLNTIDAPKGIIIFKIGDAAEKIIVK